MTKNGFTKDVTFLSKGVAVLAMVFYHLFRFKETNELYGVTSIFKESELWEVASYGNICVGIFVFLTAYGMIAKYKQSDKDLGSVTMQRFLNLILDFFCMFVFCNIVFGYFIDYGAIYEPRKRAIFWILIDGLGLATMFETPSMNGAWWYMELAYVLLLVLPVIYLGLKKFGTFFILAVGVLMPFIIPLNWELERHFFTAVLGGCAAYSGLFEKIYECGTKKWHKAIKIFVLCILFVMMIYLKDHYPYNEGKFIYYIDGIWVFLILQLCYEVLYIIPVLSPVLQYIGKNSKNIFYVHIFFIMLFEKQIYSLKCAGLMWISVVVLSLLLSMVYDKFKDIIRFQKIYNKILNGLERVQIL